jgi:NAD(P)-dependent dehydrogenase (short-subunit alcohol dehydrogenase family)
MNDTVPTADHSGATMSEPLPAHVIVGAAGGIGSAVCRRLAKSGARLLLVGKTAAKLEALADELRAINPAGEYRVHPADATKSAEIDAAFAQATEAFGPIHGAANLVGSILLKPAHLTTDAEFDDTFTLNAKTAFYLV